MNINCDMRIILHPVHIVISVYVPIQVETHHISQYDIICLDSLWLKSPTKFNLVICIITMKFLYRLNLLYCFMWCTCDFESTISDAIFLTDCSGLNAVLASTTILLSLSVEFCGQPALVLSETSLVSKNLRYIWPTECYLYWGLWGWQRRNFSAVCRWLRQEACKRTISAFS